MRARSVVYLLAGAILVAGCAHPNQANIQLRKENQALRDKVDLLQRELDAKNLPRVSTTAPAVDLSKGEYDSLFTVSGLQIKGVNPIEDDSGVRVHVALIDDSGDKIKSVGAFDVQIFDLQKTGDQLVAQAKFTPAEARRFWTSFLTMYDYALPVIWQSRPEHSQLTVRVSYVDELTHRKVNAQKVVNVDLSGK